MSRTDKALRRCSRRHPHADRQASFPVGDAHGCRSSHPRRCPAGQSRRRWNTRPARPPDCSDGRTPENACRWDARPCDAIRPSPCHARNRTRCDAFRRGPDRPNARTRRGCRSCVPCPRPAGCRLQVPPSRPCRNHARVRSTPESRTEPRARGRPCRGCRSSAAKRRICERPPSVRRYARNSAPHRL